MKKVVFALAVALMVSLVCNYRSCTQEEPETVIIERTDTLWMTKTDTLPMVSTEYITQYVKIPVPVSDSVTAQRDSVELEVVQRCYTDDTTYTAWVSGIKYDDWPRLDSVSVRQRTIIREREVIRTKERKRPLTYGVQAGVGYGLFNRQPDAFIGVGIQYNF